MNSSPFDIHPWPTSSTTVKKAEQEFHGEIIRNSPFGVPLEKLGYFEDERDTSKLCGTKHVVETWVSLGVGDESASEVGVSSEEKKTIVPGESNIIVAFYPQDTSGGGKVEAWFIKWIFTPLIKTGTVVIQSGQVLYISGGDFISNTAFWVTGGALGEDVTIEDWAQDIVEAVPEDSMTGSVLTAVGCTLGGWRWENNPCTDERGYLNRGLWSYFSRGAEEFATEVVTAMPDETYWGTSYHNANAAAHKMLATITVEREDGTIVQKQESYLVGTDEVYESKGELFQKPGIGIFKIDEPGKWTVNLESFAWGTCSNLEWNESYTFDVPTPEWWGEDVESEEEQEIESLTAKVNAKLEELNIPLGLTVATFALALIGGISLLTVKLMSKGEEAD